MKVTIEGAELVVRIPLQPATPSTSGKNLVIASTHGNMVTDCQVDGRSVIVGMNAYIKK